MSSSDIGRLWDSALGGHHPAEAPGESAAAPKVGPDQLLKNEQNQTAALPLLSFTSQAWNNVGDAVAEATHWLNTNHPMAQLVSTDVTHESMYVPSRRRPDGTWTDREYLHWVNAVVWFKDPVAKRAHKESRVAVPAKEKAKAAKAEQLVEQHGPAFAYDSGSPPNMNPWSIRGKSG